MVPAVADDHASGAVVEDEAQKGGEFAQFFRFRRELVSQTAPHQRQRAVHIGVGLRLLARPALAAAAPALAPRPTATAAAGVGARRSGGRRVSSCARLLRSGTARAADAAAAAAVRVAAFPAVVDGAAPAYRVRRGRVARCARGGWSARRRGERSLVPTDAAARVRAGHTGLHLHRTGRWVLLLVHRGEVKKWRVWLR